MWQAHRSQDKRVIALVSRNVVLADGLFTAPAIIVQPLTGLWMMKITGLSLDQTWIVLSWLLYGIAGGCWLPVVWLQIRVRNLSRQAVLQDRPLPDTYYKYMRAWFILGWPAFLSVIVIFALMVFRPV